MTATTRCALLAILLALVLALVGCGTADAIGKAATEAGKAVLAAGKCTLQRSLEVCAPACKRCVAQQATTCVLGLPPAAPAPTSQPTKGP